MTHNPPRIPPKLTLEELEAQAANQRVEKPEFIYWQEMDAWCANPVGPKPSVFYPRKEKSENIMNHDELLLHHKETDLLEDFKDMMAMSLPVINQRVPEQKFTFYHWDNISLICLLSTEDETATLEVALDDCIVWFPWAGGEQSMPLRTALQWIENIKGDDDAPVK